LTSFTDFGLAEPITRALAQENYVTPTPIQSQTIPLAMSRRDVIGIAQTGTGKTAAFALPILHHIESNRFRPERKTCRALVLSPTRELSIQIGDSFKAYGRNIRLAVAVAIGGVPINRQVRSLNHGVEVLVATPGRLLDLVNMRALSLDTVEVLVLDEADRMLDMGFIHDIRKVVRMLPKERQTLFFSATMPQAIADLAKDMLRDPARVSVAPQSTTAERVAQRVILTDKAAKQSLLNETIKAETIDRVLVFTRTKHGADKVVRNLEKAGIYSEAIHGNKSQNQRERALSAFREGRCRTLVATDIAARGIDVDGVSHVINYDMPNIPESYVHRIGRTARAGAEGVAISFVDHEEMAYLRDIEKLIRSSIPSTDRRSNPRPAASATPGGRERHDGKHAAGRNHRGKSQRGSRPGHGHGHGHGHGADKTNGSNGQNGRAQPQARPAQARPVASTQPVQHPRQQPTPSGELGGVTFLQRKPARRPVAERRTPR
jgi:ATP-dependent RNA helicase RhlE